MFNVRPKPAFPWIYVEPPPAEEVPGFRMNPDGSLRDRQRGAASGSFGYGMPSGSAAPRGFGFPTPSPDFLVPSAPSSAQFRPAPQYDVSGLNLGSVDDALLGVGLGESRNGVPRRQSPWLGEMPPALRPLLSKAFDPPTGRHIAPYQPPIGPSMEASQYARGMEDVPPYGDASSPPRGPVFAQPPGAEPPPSSASTVWPTPEPASDAAIRNAPQQPTIDAWPYAEADGAKHDEARPTVEMPQPAGVAQAPPATAVADPNFILANAGANEPQAGQPMPLPQDQPTDLKNPATPTELPGNPPGQPTEPTIAQAMEEFRHATANQIEELIGTIGTYGKRIYEDSILKAKDDLSRLVDRLRTEPAETVFSILNSFPQTRVEGNLVGGFAAVITIMANARRGADFERAAIEALSALSQTAKVTKNTGKIVVDGVGRSIPDILNAGVTEIKSGVRISNSVQLQTQAAHALAEKKPFSLIVSPTTEYISQSVRRAVVRSGGTIQRFDPVTGVFTTLE